MNIVPKLRAGAWLDQERVVAYAWMALVAHAGAALYLVLAGPGWRDIFGRPIGGDFLCFFAAGLLALKGHASSAYDFSAVIAQQAEVIPGATGYYFLWLYPPIFLLPMAALALLPYGLALAAWLAATAAAYVSVMRRILPHRWTWLVALAWPGFFDNLQHGQNAFLSAALLGGGLLLLEQRPFAAGVLLGAMAYKPQLVVLVPFALVAGSHWRALAGFGAATLLLCALATACFGWSIWPAFDSAGRGAQALLEGEHGAYFAKVGIFSAVRLAGGSVGLAWILQAASSIAAVGVVAWAWRSRAAIRLKSSVLVAAMPVAAPWVNLYDLLILALPAAWLIGEGLRGGFLPWERLMFATLALSPLWIFALAWASHLQLAPLMAAALIALALRRMPMAVHRTGASA